MSTMTLIDENGTIYIGTFINYLHRKVLHGKGEIIMEDGICYSGYFVYGKKHGIFTVYDSKKHQSTRVKYEFDVLLSSE